jgi:hypothetical protein
MVRVRVLLTNRPPVVPPDLAGMKRALLSVVVVAGTNLPATLLPLLRVVLLICWRSWKLSFGRPSPGFSNAGLYSPGVDQYAFRARCAMTSGIPFDSISCIASWYD